MKTNCRTFDSHTYLLLILTNDVLNGNVETYVWKPPHTCIASTSTMWGGYLRWPTRMVFCSLERQSWASACLLQHERNTWFTSFSSKELKITQTMKTLSDCWKTQLQEIRSPLNFRKIMHEINKPAGKDSGAKPQQFPTFLFTWAVKLKFYKNPRN